MPPVDETDQAEDETTKDRSTRPLSLFRR
jgi:hypothetical protein